jgi:hypothetical protein
MNFGSRLRLGTSVPYRTWPKSGRARADAATYANSARVSHLNMRLIRSYEPHTSRAINPTVTGTTTTSAGMGTKS